MAVLDPVGGEFLQRFVAYGGMDSYSVTAPATVILAHPMTARHIEATSTQLDTEIHLPDMGHFPVQQGYVFQMWNLGSNTLTVKDAYGNTVETLEGSKTAKFLMPVDTSPTVDPGDVWISHKVTIGPRATLF